MKRVMVSLIGEQTAPNLFLHLHFEPDIHYLLHSKKTDKHSKDLATSIGLWADETRKRMPEIPRVLIEKENEWTCVRDKVRAKLKEVGKDSEVILNVTSGTKPMTIGAWEARKSCSSPADVVYLDGGTIRHLDEKSSTEALKQEPSIRVFLMAYGYEIETTAPLDSPDLNLLARAAETAVERPELRKNLMKSGSLPKALFPEELWRELVKAGFLSENGDDLVCCKEDIFNKKSLEAIEKFWTGDWLSLCAWKIIKDKWPDREVLVGTKLKDVSGKQGYNEVDVLLFKDWKLWCVECKTSKPRNKEEAGKKSKPKGDSYYKIKEITRRIGGIFAKPVLVTTKKMERAASDESMGCVVLPENCTYPEFRENLLRILEG